MKTRIVSILMYIAFLHRKQVLVTSSNNNECKNVSYEWLDCSNLSLDFIIARNWTTTLNASNNYIGQGALDVRLLAQWKTLQSLDLTSNGIAIFIGRGTPLDQMLHLNLSRNTLFDLKPRMFTNMNDLLTLNLAFNRITLISPSAIVLPNLIELDLSSNRLTSFRIHYFQGVPSLRRLILAFNLISSIPAGTFFKCHSLVHLDLSFNRIIKVSRYAFNNATSLELFDLSNNSLDRSISTCFQTKIKVGCIVFDGNRFGNFHRHFVVGIRARELRLCRILDLFYISDASFSSLALLQVLRLEENENLRYISSEAFHQVPNLKFLSVTGNQLFTLDAQVALSIPSLQHLDLRLNAFHCDCSLKWLQDALFNSSSQFRSLNISAVPCDSENSTSTTTHISDSSALASFCEPYMEVLSTDVISVDLSANVSVKCVTSGHETPELRWINDSNSTIENCPGSRMCQSQGHLWVRSVHEQDSGTYTCVASNSLGESSKAIQIEILRPNVTLIATQVSSTFVVLHWVIRKETPRVTTCVFLYKAAETAKTHRAVLHSCHHHRFYTLIELQPDVDYNISMYKEHRGHLFKMASFIVRTSSESLMQMLTSHYKFWLLCSVVIVLVSSPVIISCVVQCTKYVYRMRRKQHSEMTMFMESDSGTCFVLDTDDTSLSVSYLNNSDDSQLLS